jgi:hypothetical protein
MVKVPPLAVFYRFAELLMAPQHRATTPHNSAMKPEK